MWPIMYILFHIDDLGIKIAVNGRIQDFNLGGVKRVTESYEVRGPKGRQQGWDCWGRAASPLPTS